MSPPFRSEADLDDALTSPSVALIADLAAATGDLVVLGAGGKMGPTLCVLARRGLDAAGRSHDKVFAVSRWSDPLSAKRLTEAGIDVIQFDLLGDRDLAELPDVSAVVFMAGAKFGITEAPYRAWAVNVALPARVAARYRHARIAAMSTGNVYPFVATGSGGSTEADLPQPVGEYAMSCLGRERIFEYAAANYGTKVAIIRLNYAVDLRYGVLTDIGRAVLAAEPVDVTTGAVNVVWQGYANEVVLRSLGQATPDPFVINVTGPETASVHQLADRFANRFGTELKVVGAPAPSALLNNANQCHKLFGYPPVPLATLVDWQADWLVAGLPTHGKPTKFGVRDGQF